MKKYEVEQALREWAQEMVQKYAWLTIRYEYSDTRNRYLVSYSPSEIIEENEEFCRESMSFEDYMNLTFFDDAPLFCDDERLFHLSEKALVIGGIPVSIPLIITGQAVIWMGQAIYESEGKKPVVLSSSEMFNTIPPVQTKEAA